MSAKSPSGRVPSPGRTGLGDTGPAAQVPAAQVLAAQDPKVPAAQVLATRVLAARAPAARVPAAQVLALRLACKNSPNRITNGQKTEDNDKTAQEQLQLHGHLHANYLDHSILNCEQVAGTSPCDVSFCRLMPLSHCINRPQTSIMATETPFWAPAMPWGC